MHANAMNSLVGRLRNGFAEGDVEQGIVDIWSPAFDLFKIEAIKHCGRWITDEDLFEFINEPILRRLPEAARKSNFPRTRLPELLPELELRGAAEEICNALARLPYTYDVYFELPRCQINGDIILSDDIAFVKIEGSDKPNALRGLLAGDATSFSSGLKGGAVYLRVRASGFASRHVEQSAMREAAALMRRVIQCGVIRGVLVTRHQRDDSEVWSEFMGNPSEKLVQAISIERGNEKRRNAVSLDANTSRRLRSISIPTNLVKALDLVGGEKSNEETARLALRWIVPAVTRSPSDLDTQSLRSALEWSFDASADLDKTLGFVKACIALEAALGEDQEKVGVTERLADRCAFLLNRTASGRARTREAMRKVYDLRSHVVHGRTRSFQGDELETRNVGFNLVRVVLDREMRAVEQSELHREAERRASEDGGAPK